MSESIEATLHHDYSETTLTSKTFVYTWKIKNFDFYGRDKKAMYLESRSKLYENEEIWSVRLEINKFSTVLSCPCLYADVTFNIQAAKLNLKFDICSFLYIIKDDETEMEVYKTSTTPTVSDNTILYNILRFQKMSDILDKNCGLLSNGDLTLKFKICGTIENVSSLIYFDSSLNKQPHCRLENLLNNKKFSDIKITVNDKELYAYKGILASGSPVFAAMFEHDMKENVDNVVQIVDIDYKVMEEVLRFIYTGKVNGIEDIAFDLLGAADKYEIEDLKIMCEKVLIKNLNVKTAINSLILAEKYSAVILKKFALEFFKLHLKEIVEDKKYEELKNLLPILPDIFQSLAQL